MKSLDKKLTSIKYLQTWSLYLSSHAIYVSTESTYARSKMLLLLILLSRDVTYLGLLVM